jgi:hypothetical protein
MRVIRANGSTATEHTHWFCLSVVSVVSVVQDFPPIFVTPPMNGTSALGTVKEPSAFW